MVENHVIKEETAFSLAQIRRIIEVPSVWEEAFTTAALADREALSKKFKIVALIGCTGSGKSATANSICGQQRFKESCSTVSETDSVTGLLSTWQGVEGEEPVIVIDTPGLGDSKGRDTGHIA